MKKWVYAFAIALFSLPVWAMKSPPIPTGPIYYEPPVVERDPQLQAASCHEIEQAINHLQPYRYTYKPNFFQDPTNQAAGTLVVVDGLPIVGSWLGLAYLGYSAIIEEKESRRITWVREQIAMLQRVKAEKFCFE